jgi:hypothetical protein
LELVTIGELATARTFKGTLSDMMNKLATIASTLNLSSATKALDHHFHVESLENTVSLVIKQPFPFFGCPRVIAGCAMRNLDSATMAVVVTAFGNYWIEGNVGAFAANEELKLFSDWKVLIARMFGNNNFLQSHFWGCEWK